VSKITHAVKTAFNYCGLEVARYRPTPAKQNRLELDYDVRIAPRWGYELEANKHIERAIAAHRARYARTLNGFLRYQGAISAIPGDSADDDPVSPHWNNPFFSGLDAASLVCFILETRPEVYFEIGSGNSTKFARHAINLDGLQTKVISLDPHPRAAQRRLGNAFHTLVDQNVAEPPAQCRPAVASHRRADFPHPRSEPSTMSSNRPSLRPSWSAPGPASPSSFDPSNRMSRQRSTIGLRQVRFFAQG